MFEEYEHVTIIESGRQGVIVDKRMWNGMALYVVEDDRRDEKGEFPLYDCTDADLMRSPAPEKWDP